MPETSRQAIDFINRLKVPEGPKAGHYIKLAPFQRSFIKGALQGSVMIGVLSIGRGNGKSALSGGLGLGELVGAWSNQPRREILIAARTRDQAAVVWDYVVGLAASLPADVQESLVYKRSPRLEIQYQDHKGDHVLRCIAANPQNALGASPTLVIMDERGHWEKEKGDDLEAALLSGLGKRNGRALIISTSASSDSHSFSQWLDDPPDGTYTLEYRPEPGLPADDMDSLLLANPGADHGIGSSPDWLKAQAQRAIKRGGSTLTNFRLYNRNERVSSEHRSVLLTVDDWLNCEVSELPPREGAAIVGIDLGGSSSMSACAIYWPNTCRLEAFGAFGCNPGLTDRGHADGVRDRYLDMAERGELVTMGQRIVPADQFLKAIMDVLGDAPAACFVGDRFRQAEFAEAMNKAGVKVPMVFRGMGFKDGGADCERFRSAVFDELVQAEPSLLLRSAFADAAVMHDPANNMKLTKNRSTGRIDAAAAAILAVAEGRRRVASPIPQARAPTWA